jgi:hypothetical protein
MRGIPGTISRLVAIFVILMGCSSDDNPVSGDPTLTALEIALGPFNEAFDPTRTSYTISAPFATTETTLTTANPTEADALVTLNGGSPSSSVKLAEGRNVLSVRVATTGGAVKTYTIEVTRGSLVNFVREAYAKASNSAANDHFGYSVALDGDTLVVGAPEEDSAEIGTAGTGGNNGAVDAGAVYVFVRTGTTWFQQAYLKASNTGAGDRFGWSVALAGDTLVVGAPLEDCAETGTTGAGGDNNAADAGAVYVFTRTGATWSQEAYLKAFNTGAGDRFGWSVSLGTNTLAVGALLEDSAETGTSGTGADNNAADAGAAYVFIRTGAAWTQEAYVKASNADAGDVFGVSVALRGNRLAVGASGESSLLAGSPANNGAASAGAVYVFLRSGTTWSEEAYLKASTIGGADAFGLSVALDEDALSDTNTLVVGSPLEDGAGTGVGADQTSNGAVDSGAVYVFVRTGTTWNQEAYVKASNTNTSDVFGWRVAVSGDALAIGAPGEDSRVMTIDGDQTDNSALTAGATYIFTRSAGVWTQLDYVKTTSVVTSPSGDGFGGSVALSGGTLAVGAIGEDSQAVGINGAEDNDSQVASGATYVFERIP